MKTHSQTKYQEHVHSWHILKSIVIFRQDNFKHQQESHPVGNRNRRTARGITSPGWGKGAPSYHLTGDRGTPSQ